MGSPRPAPEQSKEVEVSGYAPVSDTHVENQHINGNDLEVKQWRMLRSRYTENG